MSARPTWSDSQNLEGGQPTSAPPRPWEGGSRGALALWAAVALLAGSLRFVGLENVPLDSDEARLAFAAWRAVLGHDPEGITPTDGRLFLHLTVWAFALFGASDAVARLVSAAAGTAIALAPLILAPVVGARAALAAALLLATSPIAVDLGRRADPASLTMLLALAAVGSAIRMATDRPAWAPWLLAGTVGASLSHEPALAASLILAVLAAAAIANLAGLQVRLLAAEVWRGIKTARGPAAFGAATSVLCATGGLMDLRGIGFVLGDLWGALPSLIDPIPLALRNLVALGAYVMPVAAIAGFAAIRAFRQGNALEAFLAVWAGLLLVLAVAGSKAVLAFALLPVVPIALLAGLALRDLPWSFPSYRLSGAGWAALTLSLALLGILLVVGADSLGASRAPGRAALVGGPVVVGLLIVAWRRATAAGEHGAVLALLGALLFTCWTVSSVGRASFGGSPPAAEPLRPEPTDPRLPVALYELSIASSVNPQLSLRVETAPPATIWWYGRAIPRGAPGDPSTAGGIVVREASAGGAPSGAGAGTRVPWKIRSVLRTEDLHPLGVARWALSRQGVLVGVPQDVIVIRS